MVTSRSYVPTTSALEAMILNLGTPSRDLAYIQNTEDDIASASYVERSQKGSS